MTEFNYEIDADGVATITWDLPGKSMNVMSYEGLGELDALLWSNRLVITRNLVGCNIERYCSTSRRAQSCVGVSGRRTREY